jgi:choline kinase
VKAVVLAAGQGTRLHPLTLDRPKPLVEVAGRPLLLRTLDRLAAVGLRGADVVVVGGYRIDLLRAALATTGVSVIENDHFADRGNFQSLLDARAATRGHAVLQLDGDVLFDATLLPRLLAAPGPGALAVDVRADLDAETMKVAAQGDVITAVSKQLGAEAIGEYIGITRLDAALAAEVMDDLAGFAAAGLGHEYYDHAYHRMATRGGGRFRLCSVGDLGAIEIDDLDDLRRAEALVRARAVA